MGVKYLNVTSSIDAAKDEQKIMQHTKKQSSS
jgi:hypothetical protein